MKRKAIANHIRLVYTLTVIALCAACGNSDETVSEDQDAEEIYFEDYRSPERKWGFIDREGNTIVEPKYDQVSAFSEGLAAVNSRGRWGFIDREGNVIINYAYRAAWPFHEGVARVTLYNGTYCLLQRDGDTTCFRSADAVYDCSSGRVRFEKDYLFGFADIWGNVIINPIYVRAGNFHNGLAVVTLSDKQGLIDTSGAFVVQASYDKVSLPASGRIVAYDNDKAFYLDRYGQRISDKTYPDATDYQDSVAAVRTAGGWMLIDWHEKPVVPQLFDHLRPAGEECWVARRDGACTLVHQSGAILTSFVYQQINNFREGLAVYGRDNLFGYLAPDGREVTAPQFGLAWDFHEGLARAAFRDGIAYITPTGRVPFIPEYPELRDFSQGLAPVQE